VKIKLKYAVIIGLTLGVAAAGIYFMSRPLEVRDKTPVEIDEARHEISLASRDIITHNEKTVTEVRIIRETIAQNVAALAPDELVLSLDEFIGRWRGYSGKPPAGPAGLDGDS
jgi:hypothetical protein